MDKKIVVITGASSGIGAALAIGLGTAGHRVVLAARRAEQLREVAQRVGTNAVPVTADATRRDDVLNVKKLALEACGRIDVWINNAGRGIVRPALELSDDDLDEMISVNVKSALYGMQAIVPYFREKGTGHLINVSSFLGRVPLVSVRSAYNAAKAALNALTANMRMDLSRDYPRIHVSLVMPGMVLTDFAANALGAPPQQSPAPRGGPTNAQTAEEIADVIVSLIKKPVAEIFTNPASAQIAREYQADIAAFEHKMLDRR